MWNWTKENAGAAAAIATIFLGLAAIIQFGVLNPIHQRFDAINQRFDAQDRRIDDLKAEINQRFDAQDKYMNQRFNAVDQRFNAVDQRFNTQDRRIEDLAKDISELRKLSERVSRNEGQIDVIRQQIQAADAPSP